MARTRWVPEQEKPEPRYGKGDRDARDEGDSFEEPVGETPWEFLSVANFLEQLAEEERAWYTTAELVGLAAGTGTNNRTLHVLLEGHGFILRGQKSERAVRTFGDNPHDRWTCAEALRMNGGGGGSAIIGMVD